MSMNDARAPCFTNLNHAVCVRLTEHGRLHHRNHWRAMFETLGADEDYIRKHYNAPQETEDGWSEWQLWDLMSNFGEAMHMAPPVPFETEMWIGTLAQLRAHQRA